MRGREKKKIRRGREQRAEIVGGVLSCSVFLSVLLCILPIKGLRPRVGAKWHVINQLSRASARRREKFNHQKPDPT